MSTASKAVKFVSCTLLIGIACMASGMGPSAEAASQPPVMITFDVHADPMPQNVLIEDRRILFYEPWIKNGNWLMDQVEPLGAKVSFLSTGEFLEFCLEDPQRESTCFPLLRRFYNSGGIIGTHTHQEIHDGWHSWPNLVGEPTAEQIVRNWDDTKTIVDRVIRKALGITDPAAIAAVNTARGSHLPNSTVEKHSMLETYGYTILEGGPDQELTRHFSHVPFTAYRPGDCNLCENLQARFMTVPQSTVIGQVDLHMGIWQDGSAERKQAEILQLLANRRIQDLQGAVEKPWSYGWGVHLSDISLNSPSRQAIAKLLPWLSTNVVSPRLGFFASYPEARDLYTQWEASHPGQSSFTYPYATTDYIHYPYSEWANHYLRYSRLATRVSATGADAFLMRAGDYSDATAPRYPLVLSYSYGSVTTVNLSGELGTGPVRRIRLNDGQVMVYPSNAVRVDAIPAVVCRPMDCDAIVALESIL
ncbi:MAG TPA: hypothetical protein VN604_08505 [Nitrospirota bacterium]|nr:hypothetical protein [Nitrospirota bacterium]